MTDTTATGVSPLDRLHAEAATRGWTPDRTNSHPGRWRPADEPQTSFTVTEPGDHLGMSVFTATTDRGSFRLVLDHASDFNEGIDQLRRFLRWGHNTDSGEAAS